MIKNLTIGLILALTMISCSKIDKKDTIEYRTQEEILIEDDPYGRTMYKYIIDSCEYIGCAACGQNSYLAHKGNCKFCKQRNEFLQR